MQFLLACKRLLINYFSDNNLSNCLKYLFAFVVAKNVTIPSVFIGAFDGLLLQQYSNRTELVSFDAYWWQVVTTEQQS